MNELLYNNMMILIVLAKERAKDKTYKSYTVCNHVAICMDMVMRIKVYILQKKCVFIILKAITIKRL